MSCVLFGTYSPFTTWASLGSDPDYTLPRALHVCEGQFGVQHLAQGHLWHADGKDWDQTAPSGWRTTALPLRHRRPMYVNVTLG